jgi:hypothetical protein
MSVIRWIFGLLVVAILAIAAVAFLARIGDGPMGPFPGGPLRSGPMMSLPSDWDFATNIPEVELQLESQDLSRTTWILVYDGQAYIPCSLDFPPFKTWYKKAVQDGRAIVRIEGKRYPVMLRRIDAEATDAALRQIAARKYSSGPRPPEGRVWFFRLDARS